MESITNPKKSPAPTNSSSPEAPSNVDDIVTPAGVGIVVDDVNKSLWQYIRHRKMKQLVLLGPLLIVWEVLVIYLFVELLRHTQGNNSQSGRGIGYLLVAPLVAVSSWYYHLKKQFEDAFLEEFAKSNGYVFNKATAVDETYGTLFRISSNQSVSDVIDGKYQDSDFRLFLCDLTVGSGRSQQKFRETVIEIDLHGKLPDLLMVDKHLNYGALSFANSFGIKNTFSLEGDFNKYFTLYGNEANRIEALEVFSPDTMALMEDESKHYTVEFAGNRIYIYANGYIDDKQSLIQAFALAKKLIAKIAPLASRLQNDSAIIPTPVNIVDNRKQQNLARNISLILAGMFMFFGIILFLVIANTKSNQPNYGTNNTPQVTLTPGTPAYKAAVSRGLQVSSGWLAYVRSGDTPAAYKLETSDYQRNYSQEKQKADFATLKPYGDTVSEVGTLAGVYNDTQVVSVMYKFRNTINTFYLEVYVIKDNGTWLVSGETSSYQPIQPDLLY